MESNTPLSLTLEQQFGIAAFNNQVDQMSGDQAKELLKMVNKQLEITKTAYNQLLAHSWGIGDSGTNQRPTAGQG